MTYPRPTPFTEEPSPSNTEYHTPTRHPHIHRNRGHTPLASPDIPPSPSIRVMSIHKLTAGDGYTYLTRQVAAFDTADRRHLGLEAYYTAAGESPGMWLGAGLPGLAAGDAAESLA